MQVSHGDRQLSLVLMLEFQGDLLELPRAGQNARSSRSPATAPTGASLMPNKLTILIVGFALIVIAGVLGNYPSARFEAKT